MKNGSSQNAGPGSGSGSGSGFFFPQILAVILLYSYLRMNGICPSFMVEISKKIEEHADAMQVVKGHVLIFFSKSGFVSCEHLALPFRKSEFVF